jgi:hypothetical protein
MSLSTQAATLQFAKDKLQTMFDVQVFTFIPPYDNFNDETIAAMKQNQLTVISSSDWTGDFPREQNGVMYIPETAITANLDNQSSWAPVPLESIVQQIRDSWASYGIAIVTLHPQQFTGQQDIWNTYLRLLDWIPKNGGTIIKLDPPSPSIGYVFDPIQLSVGVLIGIVSTLLVYTAAGKRSDGKRQREERETVEQVRQPNLVIES